MKKTYHFTLVILAVLTAITSVVVLHRFRESGEEIAYLKNELREVEARNRALTVKARRAYEIPIEIRQHATGRITVLNQSTASLPLTVNFSNGEEQSFVVLKSEGRGFRASAGEQIKISSAGFDPILVTVK